MALRDFTLSNMMIWGAGALALIGTAGVSAALWMGNPEPVVMAMAMAPPVAVAPLPSIPAAPAIRPKMELPKLRMAVAKPRPAVRLPLPPPRPVVRTAQVRARPTPVLPSYSPPPPQWQRAYMAAPYPLPYYAYQPRYLGYSPYPGY